MSLKYKIGLILAVVFIVSGLANYAIQQFLIYPSFIALEREEALKDLKRCQDAINREVFHLSTITKDWAFWDDTYDFVVSKSKDYIASNLPIATFIENGINLVYYVDLDGSVVWGKIYDIETEEVVKLPSIPDDTLHKTHPLVSPLIDKKLQANHSVSGILMTERGPMLVNSQLIRTSINEGPDRGVLIMGRFLNEQIVQTLAQQTGVDFQIFTIGDTLLPEAIKTISRRMNIESSRVIEQEADNNLLLYSIIPDITSSPSLLLRVNIPRQISVSGSATLRYASLAIFVIAATTLVFLLLALQQIVLKPIQNLSSHVRAISNTGNLSERLVIDRQDEIGILVNNHNRMLEILESQSSELVHINERLTQDIDARIQAEKALVESEKKINRLERIELLGILAGGVAHDLNNILSGIVSYPELLLMDKNLDQSHKRSIEIMHSSGQKAATIVADLLTLARGVATDKKIVNLNDRVTEYLLSPVFQKVCHYHPAVNINTILDPDLLNIKGSPVHIDKIVMNLVSNAAEAIKNDGTITIFTSNLYLDRPFKGYSEIEIGEYVALSVSDDGPGIPEEDLERVFEPFYSKKVLGRSGTGLGLSVVWTTVQDHGGYIDIESTGNGTTFKVYLPVARDEEVEEKLELTIEELKGAGQTILVVDDEEQQRVIVSAMLGKLGYQVIVVGSGEEALEFLQDNKVELVLLDMIMEPGINGRETYERIQNIHPHQKAILTSGYSETEEVKKALQLGVAQYIQKPYSIQKIAEAIKSALQK